VNPKKQGLYLPSQGKDACLGGDQEFGASESREPPNCENDSWEYQARERLCQIGINFEKKTRVMT
jgi:hypothetical protein